MTRFTFKPLILKYIALIIYYQGISDWYPYFKSLNSKGDIKFSWGKKGL